MAKNRIERRVVRINIAYLAAIVPLTIILAVRFKLSGSCGDCFVTDLANVILLYTLAALCFGYIASIPIMIYKVWRSKKKVDDDCDEGSCSY